MTKIYTFMDVWEVMALRDMLDELEANLEGIELTDETKEALARIRKLVSDHLLDNKEGCE